MHFFGEWLFRGVVTALLLSSLACAIDLDVNDERMWCLLLTDVHLRVHG
jgi:hypothetical protein